MPQLAAVWKFKGEAKWNCHVAPSLRWLVGCVVDCYHLFAQLNDIVRFQCFLFGDRLSGTSHSINKKPSNGLGKAKRRATKAVGSGKFDKCRPEEANDVTSGSAVVLVLGQTVLEIYEPLTFWWTKERRPTTADKRQNAIRRPNNQRTGKKLLKYIFRIFLSVHFFHI